MRGGISSTGRWCRRGAHGRYEDECFAFDVSYYKRYTQIYYDKGDSTLLFTIVLKTVGAFGVSG